MSLIGIDIGSGSVKIAAYSNVGECLALESESFATLYPKPGWWELEPREVWRKTFQALCQVAQLPAVQKDAVEALSISASGREVFPVDGQGRAIGTCIMAGDMREHGIETAFEIESDADVWLDACGHLPERMDPVCRILWWRKNFPSVVRKAKYFLGWHEFLTLKLCGRPATDPGLASKWLVYDRKNHQWSEKYLNAFGIDPKTLPEILPWGETIGRLDNKLAEKAGLPLNVKVATGSFDACCSALGTGVASIGTACLLSGSWENLIIPATEGFSYSCLIKNGVFAGPYPGETASAVFALNPNGNSVVNWACRLTKSDIREIDREIEKSIDEPSEILAVPQFSIPAVPFGSNSNLAASFEGLSLATSPADIVKSLKESIAFNLLITMDFLNENGVKVEKLRVSGGGARSVWWTQLKSDLMGLPIETISHEETGTVGAAILAGVALGIFKDTKQGSDRLVKAVKRYEPDNQRAMSYQNKINRYKETVFGLSRYGGKLKVDIEGTHR